MDKGSKIAIGLLICLFLAWVLSGIFAPPGGGAWGHDWQGYAKCEKCNTAYQLRWGLPMQFDIKRSRCRNCGGKLYRCSKAESGWRDDRPLNYTGD